MCYSRCIALHFQVLQLVRLTDQWSAFYQTSMNRLNGKCLVSSAINKKERETCKVQCGSTKWKVLYIVYEKNVEIIKYEFADARVTSFTWNQYLSWFIHFCIFKIWYCKKQHLYCFLLFGFINVIIFVINPFGSCSTFVGVDLECPNSLRYDRSSWSELRYFNFEPTLKLWWRRARDFNGSQTLVTSGRFLGFSKFFCSENSKLWAFMCVIIFSTISNINCC